MDREAFPAGAPAAALLFDPSLTRGFWHGRWIERWRSLLPRGGRWCARPGGPFLPAVAMRLLGKARWYDTELLQAPRAYPSTRRCPACGIVGAPLPRGQRAFACAACGPRCDRDLNAARNLARNLARWGPAHTQRQVAVKHTETVNARGGEGAGRPISGGETGPGEAGTATTATE